MTRIISIIRVKSLAFAKTNKKPVAEFTRVFDGKEFIFRVYEGEVCGTQIRKTKNDSAILTIDVNGKEILANTAYYVTRYQDYTKTFSNAVDTLTDEEVMAFIKNAEDRGVFEEDV